MPVAILPSPDPSSLTGSHCPGSHEDPHNRRDFLIPGLTEWESSSHPVRFHQPVLPDRLRFFPFEVQL